VLEQDKPHIGIAGEPTRAKDIKSLIRCSLDGHPANGLDGARLAPQQDVNIKTDLQEVARQKAVWGPKRRHSVWRLKQTLALVALLTIGLATSAYAAVNGTQQDRGANRGPALKPGQVNDQVKDYKIDPEVTRRVNGGTSRDTISLVVTLLPGQKLPSQFKPYARGGRLSIINGYQLSHVPIGLVSTIASNSATKRVHFDRPTKPHDALSTSAVSANASDPAHLINQQLYAYTGSGVHVAIIDSGIASDSLPDLEDGRVSFVNFADSNPLRHDGFGHGTHVAGIVAGDGTSNPKYAGMAPGASIVSLKVLDDTGVGTMGDILAALSWINDHPEANIRVVSMSVGAAVTESYWTDPLTLAVKVLVDQGITVVVAAGNFGEDPNGNLQWGAITSPGIAPWVLTVCAFSTQGTYDASDDVMASFSSSGPTAVDFGAKPDLCASGMGVVSLASPGSVLYAEGAQATPKSWLVGADPTNPNSVAPYEVLSGTSMATPSVTGAVALMLEANPNLTPNLIKAILQYTAHSQPGISSLRQGAGFMNVNGALALATAYANMPAALSQPAATATSVAAVATLPVPSDWSKTVIWGNQMLTGGIINPYGNAWTPGVEWGWATTQIASGDPVVWGTLCAGSCDNIVFGTASNGDNIVWGTAAAANTVSGTAAAGNIVWGTAAPGDNIVWGTSAAANIVWGTAINAGNIVWGTAAAGNIVWGTSAASNIVWGTSAASNIVWGTNCGGGDCNVVWGSMGPDNIVWGTATSSNIVWGTAAAGNIVWGTSASNNIVWGTAAAGNIVWGTADEAENVVWPVSAGGK
jgi:serine protease AprX